MTTTSLRILLLAGILFLTQTSCMTAGRDFPEEHVPQIEIGKTTQEDVRNLFGPPWRTGSAGR